MAKKTPTSETPETSLIKQATQRHAGSHLDASLLWDQVFEVGAALIDHESKVLSKYKLSRSRLRVLLLLNEEPKRRPSYLAETLGITKASITGLAESLSKDGLISAAANTRDRRSHTLSITAKGKGLLKKTLPGYYPKLAEALASLSRQEQAQLSQILQKWVSGIRKA
ncbi:MAG TPA: MarR family winged helix-turn-helix transcriptional regulator [Chthoniobacterales bacterium]